MTSSTKTLGTLFVMSAPSGVGKTTLKDLVLKDFPKIKYSISATTRAPRSGEVDGEHYFFKTQDEFKSMIEQNQLIEYMEVHKNFYGTPKAFIESQIAQGVDIILDLDVYGKINFDKEYPEAIGIMILPPSLEEMERRLRSRGTDSEEVIQTRLTNAQAEIEFAQSQGKYEYQLINDDLETCAKELEDLISHNAVQYNTIK